MSCLAKEPLYFIFDEAESRPSCWRTKLRPTITLLRSITRLRNFKPKQTNSRARRKLDERELEELEERRVM